MEYYLLLIAAGLCACCAILSFVPTKQKFIRTITITAWCVSVGLVTFATALLITYQVLSRFDYQYVYSHTALNTPLLYKISALWSGQEGSFLLWALILGVMGFFVLRLKGKGANRAFGIYAAISFCIYIMSFISQPFAKAAVVATDGLGLNAALMDPWMVVHPPLVFISYSAMAILFALVATISKDFSQAVNNRILTWTRFSWFSLGVGILTESVWAYNALGWGGYWAWDPIENAALVPWLVMCGFLHRKNISSLSVCIIPFLIASFGVFLARSGILKDQSAHAYTDGNAIITAIVLSFIVGAILFLVFWKVKKHLKLPKQPHKFKLPLLQQTSLCLYVYAALIFIGTVAPIILKIETPMLYYTVISVAFALCYSILLLVRDLEWLKKRNIPALAISTVLVMCIMIVSDSTNYWWLLLLWICMMPLSLWLACAFRTNSWKYYLSHLGVVLLIVGAITSTALSSEIYSMAKPGANAIIGGVEIPLATLYQKDTLIKSMLTQDIVIESAKMTTTADGGVLIPYITKPLIIIFWLGCFAVIIQSLIFLIIRRLRKPPQKKTLIIEKIDK